MANKKTVITTQEDAAALRGFQVIADFADKGITIPQRKTENAAGYDLASAIDTEVYPKRLRLVPTGLKAYMQSDEYLSLSVRSGLSTKNRVILINAPGIVDSDYYNNPDNEGHIMLALYNLSDEILVVKKGDRVGQGIFTKYLKTDEDFAGGKREGGYGSTGK